MSVCNNHDNFSRWEYSDKCPVCLAKEITEKDATIAKLKSRMELDQITAAEVAANDANQIAQLNARVKELEGVLEATTAALEMKRVEILLGAPEWDEEDTATFSEAQAELDRTK